MKIAQLGWALALGVLSAACAAEGDEEGEELPIDSTEQAFGELSCSGATADVTFTGFQSRTCPSRPLLSDLTVAYSPSETYGSASCTRAYVVNHQAIQLDWDNWLEVRDAGGSLPTTQVACEAMHVELKAYAPGFSSAIASAEKNGVWSGSACTLQAARVVLPTTNPFVFPPTPLTSVKVIAQSVRRSYTSGILLAPASYRKVSTWLNSGYCNNL